MATIWQEGADSGTFARISSIPSELAVEGRFRDRVELAGGDHLRDSARRLARRLVDEHRGKALLEVEARIGRDHRGDAARPNVADAIATDVDPGRVVEQDDLAGRAWWRLREHVQLDDV